MVCTLSVPNRGLRRLDDSVTELFAGQQALTAYISAFETAWSGLLAPDDWRATLKRWHEIGVPFEMIAESAEIARDRNNISESARFRYMCGIVWNKVRSAGIGGY